MPWPENGLKVCLWVQLPTFFYAGKLAASTIGLKN